MTQITDINTLVVGASGAIGGAVIKALLRRDPTCCILALSRRDPAFPSDRVLYRRADITDEASLEGALDGVTRGHLRFAFVASGLLHGAGLAPEKALKQLNAAALAEVMAVNAFGPALVARLALPLMPKRDRAVFAAISARVGSISDNRLGGWHAYRASKAALNMLLKTIAIEAARTHPDAVIAGLHPGTVASDLSAPFQKGVAEGKLFTPDYSAEALLDVLERLSAVHSGRVFAYDGSEVPA